MGPSFVDSARRSAAGGCGRGTSCNVRLGQRVFHAVLRPLNVYFDALFSPPAGARCHAGQRSPMVASDTGPGQPFLARLAPDEVAAIRSRAILRHFERGSTLMHQEEVPGRVIVIERGHTKVTLLCDDGKEVVLAFRGPGELLGEVSA